MKTEMSSKKIPAIAGGGEDFATILPRGDGNVSLLNFSPGNPGHLPGRSDIGLTLLLRYQQLYLFLTGFRNFTAETGFAFAGYIKCVFIDFPLPFLC